MGTSSKALAKKLRKLADRQHGCFTAAQAVETGYADSVHLYHVKNGKWIRVFRGIYRFADMPETPASRCMAALLWTRDKGGMVQGVLLPPTVEALQQGTLTPETAIQIGVPKGFRRSSRAPENVQIEKLDRTAHTTSKMNGLRIALRPVQPKCPPLPEPPGNMDRPDYYDWIDYQAARCSSDS